MLYSTLASSSRRWSLGQPATSPVGRGHDLLVPYVGAIVVLLAHDLHRATSATRTTFPWEPPARSGRPVTNTQHTRKRFCNNKGMVSTLKGVIVNTNSTTGYGTRSLYHHGSPGKGAAIVRLILLVVVLHTGITRGQWIVPNNLGPIQCKVIIRSTLWVQGLGPPDRK